MKEFRERLQELEIEYNRWVKKVKQLDPNCIGTPGEPHEYYSKKRLQELTGQSSDQTQKKERLSKESSELVLESPFILKEANPKPRLEERLKALESDETHPMNQPLNLSIMPPKYDDGNYITPNTSIIIQNKIGNPREARKSTTEAVGLLGLVAEYGSSDEAG
eukprot:TRINITY_DN3431_c0_g1_i2.p1 TRINITY_DN3431_c0_g1~~TRINITY_DN3431_c0_g1_i2.p1  ORF type:complete len:163 (-),score=39.27 TRINITY_DN3431_c0_g1_i2:40-528(-)